MLPVWMASHLGEELATVEKAVDCLEGGKTHRQAAEAAGLGGESGMRRVKRWQRRVSRTVHQVFTAMGRKQDSDRSLSASRSLLGIPDGSGWMVRTREFVFQGLLDQVLGPLALFRGAFVQEDSSMASPQRLASPLLRPPGG